jgi:myo-inositol-1(or 4)-monophosphatase
MNDAPPPLESADALAASAAEFAGAAGRLLLGLFGKRVEVDYKNKQKTDPVSEADRASQRALTDSITARYPGHAVLGEEKPKDETETKREAVRALPEYLWVLDPLDGTKNFLNGLAVWGCSVGVLHRGRPVAGAIFTPESSGSGGEGRGTIYRAWEGGGAWRDGRPIRVAGDDQPTGKRIATLPGAYWTQFRATGPLKRSLGEIRSTGSMAYDQALVARGGLHYAILGTPSIWDVAAGVLLVKEAGGEALALRSGSQRWSPLASFYPQGEAPKDLEAARRWRRPLLFANPALASFIAAHIRKVNRPRLWHGLSPRN